MEPVFILFKPEQLENLKRGFDYISRDLARLRGMADFVLRPKVSDSISVIQETAELVVMTTSSLSDNIDSVGALFLDCQRHGTLSSSSGVNISLASKSLGNLSSGAHALSDFALLLSCSKHEPNASSVNEVLMMLLEELEFHSDGFLQVLFPDAPTRSLSEHSFVTYAALCH